jgi:Protein of unknown function (DUF4238)
MVSKRHHAVPRFYLSRFAKDDGLIWLHNIETQSAVRVQPKNAIVEKFLYAPEVGDNPKDDTYERFLAEHIEGPAAPALERLADGEAISSEERERIALFIAFQELRVPRVRDAVTKMVTEVGKGLLDISVEHPDYMKRIFEEMGKPISDEELSKLIEAWKSGGIKIEATKTVWLQAAPVAIEIAAMLTRMPWTVLEAPDGVEFLTSDTPIVKVVTDPTVPPMLAGGWLSPSAESTFALDPHHVLAIKPDGKEGRFGVRKSWCKDVNARLISQARRFVVSSSRDDYVEPIAKEWMRIRAKSAGKPQAS